MQTTKLQFGSCRTIATQPSAREDRWEGFDQRDIHGLVNADAGMLQDLAPEWLAEVGSRALANAIAANSRWGLWGSPDAAWGDGSPRGWSPVIIGKLPTD